MILNEFGLLFDIKETFLGFVVVGTDSKRFLLCNALWILDEEEETRNKMKDCVTRYGITASFSIEPNDSFTGYDLAMEEAGNFTPDGINFVDVVDELVKDDTLLQIAKTYGLSNTDYLRFRLTGELPDDKTRPISTQTS